MNEAAIEEATQRFLDEIQSYAQANVIGEVFHDDTYQMGMMRSYVEETYWRLYPDAEKVEVRLYRAWQCPVWDCPHSERQPNTCPVHLRDGIEIKWDIDVSVLFPATTKIVSTVRIGNPRGWLRRWLRI